MIYLSRNVSIIFGYQQLFIVVKSQVCINTKARGSIHFFENVFVTNFFISRKGCGNTRGCSN